MPIWHILNDFFLPNLFQLIQVFLQIILLTEKYYIVQRFIKYKKVTLPLELESAENIFVPIHLPSHWSMANILLKDKIIKIMDSMDPNGITYHKEKNEFITTILFV